MSDKDYAQIFVLEDNIDAWNIVDRALNDKYTLVHAKTVAEARSILERERFDLLLLDVVLPDATGFELCSWAQTQPFLKGIPIVFLTSKGELDARLQGFELGADDYIPKPCTMKELRARIDVKIRRRKQAVGLQFDGLTINFLEQRVLARIDNKVQELDLTPREYKLLTYLARHAGSVLTRSQILREVWGGATESSSNINVSSRSIDTHIAALRKKMGPFARYIKSVHGAGYRFQPPPQRSSERSA
jgi:DNA-binding response OmpR family regulator